MKLLGVDTATEACSVALWLDGEVHERFEVAGREHSARLPALFAELLASAALKPAQLDGLVAGVGPGSFAGVRIGVAFIKGLALGLDRPVLGISSLAMLAQGAIRGRGAAQVLAAIDARMQEIYVGAYRNEKGLARAIGDEAVVAADRFVPPPLDHYAAVGSGWQGWGAAMTALMPSAPHWIDPAALPHVQDALPLAVPEFQAGRAIAAADLVPNYLRNRVALTSLEQAAARSNRSVLG